MYLGVALERDSQGTDLPDQFGSRQSVGSVKRDADSPYGRAALLDETVEEAQAVCLGSQDQQIEPNGGHFGTVSGGEIRSPGVEP